MQLEKKFQADLIKELKARYPNDIIFKNDAKQGMPDILILHQNTWAALECKRSADAPHRPNQDHYVEVMDEMAFARFIFPENKEEVLDELERSFALHGSARFSRGKQVPLARLR